MAELENSNTETQDNQVTQQAPQDSGQQGEQNTQGTIAGGAGHTPEAGAPEAYDFKGSLPDGAELDETVAKEFGDLCKNMNLTNDQANEMAKYGYSYAQNIAQAMQDAHTKEMEQWGEDAKKTLGANFDSTVQLVGTAVETLEKTIPGIRQVLNETGAGNRVEVLQALAMFGKMVQEDHGPEGKATAGNTDNMYPNTNWDNL